jgi:DnaK suppressor protein
MQDEKTRLEQELANIREQIARLETALETQPDYGMGQGDPAVTGWEVNRALLEGLQTRQESVERALARFKQGTYGLCTECGQEIDPDRLSVLPHTKLCIRCARNKQAVPVR